MLRYIHSYISWLVIYVTHWKKNTIKNLSSFGKLRMADVENLPT
jgi:hypothetical protein